MTSNLYLSVLKLRKYLQAVSQCSYTYSQINKRYSPIENLTDDQLGEVYETYRELLGEVKQIVSECESTIREGAA